VVTWRQIFMIFAAQWRSVVSGWKWMQGGHGGLNCSNQV